MDELVTKPRRMAVFITCASVTANEVDIWGQTEPSLCARVERQLTAYHKHLSDIFAAQSLKMKPIVTPQVGDQFLTRFHNDLDFVRVSVTHVDHDSRRALAFAMDLGSEEWVPFKHLVDMPALFKDRPLAQRYCLADIQPKGKEWDYQNIQKALKPYLFTVFICEVIKMNRNTEYIRVYDQLFNQPLVKTLIKSCDGVVDYDIHNAHVLEAIDLTIRAITDANDSIDSKLVNADISQDIQIDSNTAAQEKIANEKGVSKTDKSDAIFKDNIHDLVSKKETIYMSESDGDKSLSSHCQLVSNNDEISSLTDVSIDSKPTNGFVLHENQIDSNTAAQETVANEAVANEAVVNEKGVSKTDKSDVTVEEDIHELVSKKETNAVSASDGDKSFDCQLVSDCDISSLIDIMTDYYNKIKNSSECDLNSVSLSLGDMIAVQYSVDNLWYRASVKAIDSNKLIVRYIDKGNEETVELSNCKALAQQFVDLKPKGDIQNADVLDAIDCTIRAVTDTVSIDSKLTNGPVLEKQIDSNIGAQEMVINQKGVSETDKSDVTLKDDIKDSSKKESMFVSSLDGDKQSHCQLVSDVNNEETVELSNCNALAQQLVDPKPQAVMDNMDVLETIDVSPISTITSTNVAIDSKPENGFTSQEKQIDSNTSPQEMVVNEAVVNEKGVSESEKSDVTVKEDIHELVSRKESIFVSASGGDKSFHCQLVSDYDEISSLTDIMTDYYNKIKNSNECDLNSAALALKDIIAVQYSVDNLWYRASVKVIDSNKLIVRYIDYGNEETVELSKCKSLAQQFVGPKPQAIKCSLIDDIPLKTLKDYENNMNEIVCQFVSFDDNAYKVKIIEVI